MITIYHNARCRKSREALALIEDSGHEVTIREYLKHPPSTDEIIEILNQLDMRPIEIIRKGEAVYKEKYKGKELTDIQWIQILAEHPILIERPIVTNGNKAVLGRPIENLAHIL